MIYFFSEKNYRGNHAGTKARNDVETILNTFNAKPINRKVLELSTTNGENIKSNIKNRLGYYAYLLEAKLQKGKTVVIQYPMLSFDIQYEYVKTLSKKNKVIFLVHDIQSLRRDDHSDLTKEIKLLNMADALIVHNHFMKEKLQTIGITVDKIYLLNCFDYLCKEYADITYNSERIVFAGNLEKSIFLSDMIENNEKSIFNLFGSGYREALKKHCNAYFCGNFSPDEIPEKLTGRYGLVWDGESIVGCTGAVGEYMRINNPHKMSLYIAAGIPIITWSEAAISEFVLKNNIGIILNEITDLKKSLDALSEGQYLKMKNNIMTLRKRVINGEFLMNILKQIDEDYK